MSTNTSRQPAVGALDREAARAAISAAALRLAALLRDTEGNARPRGTDWTVGETAAHVSIVLTGFCAAIAGEHVPTPQQSVDADFHTRLAATNAAYLDMVDNTDIGAIVGQITAGAQRFLSLAAEADADQACQTPWYGPGRTRTVDCLTALALGELTVHGHDVATATGRPWPISTAHANLIVGTVCPHMAPLVIRPDAGRGSSLTYEIRMRGDGPRWVVTVADGKATVRAAGGRVDCVISANPVTYLLVVYGRMSTFQAMLRGGMTMTGRSPWLGLGFKDMFFNP